MRFLLKWTTSDGSNFPNSEGRAVTRYYILNRAVEIKRFGQKLHEHFVEFVSLSWLVMLMLYFNVDLTH
jgi:hypothetical protein